MLISSNTDILWSSVRLKQHCANGCDCCNMEECHRLISTTCRWHDEITLVSCSAASHENELPRRTAQLQILQLILKPSLWGWNNLLLHGLTVDAALVTNTGEASSGDPSAPPPGFLVSHYVLLWNVLWWNAMMVHNGVMLAPCLCFLSALRGNKGDLFSLWNESFLPL